MRFISNRGNRIRFVAFSTSLEDADSFGDWIGATQNNIFNAPPCIKPVTVEIHGLGTNINNFEAKMESLSKPTYTAIVQHAKNSKPTIVFVPTQKYTRLTAVDLMTLSSVNMYMSGEEPSFLIHSIEQLSPFIDRIIEPELKETLKHGVGYAHEGLTINDQGIVNELFELGYIQVCIMSAAMCWGTSLRAHLVVIMGTQCFDGQENVFTDYPASDLLQMMGRCFGKLQPYYSILPRTWFNFPDKSRGECVIFCPSSHKEYYSKTFLEGLPVESHLHQQLHDFLNAEVISKTIETKDQVLGFLKYTFMYRRLQKRPDYYGLQDVSLESIALFFKTLADNVFDSLAVSKCVYFEHNQTVLIPRTLGKIASDAYINYASIERFSSSLTEETNLKDLLNILASAMEYTQLPIRYGEEILICELINHLRFPLENINYKDPRVKANILLQLHFSRQMVTEDLGSDQQTVILAASRLLQGMCYIILIKRWRSLALLAMGVSQMVTQGMWESDSVLLQLPHFTKDLANKCVDFPQRNIKTITDFIKLKEDEKRGLLEMSDSQLTDIENFCNRYPKIVFSYNILDGENIRAGQNIKLWVTLERKSENMGVLGPVDAKRYPQHKEEGWWIVVGNAGSNRLLDFKKVLLEEKSTVRLHYVTASKEPGRNNFIIYFKSDSYMGCDHELVFTVDVKPAAATND